MYSLPNEISHWICLLVSIFLFFYVMLQMNNPKKNNLVGLESLKLLTVVGFVIALYEMNFWNSYIFYILNSLSRKYGIESLLFYPKTIISSIVNILFLILHIVYWVKICRKKKTIKMYVEKMNETQVKNSQPVKANSGETQNSNAGERVQSASNATVLPSNTPILNYTKTKGVGEKSTTDLAALLTSIFTIPFEALIYFTNLETDTEWVSLWGSEKFEREVTYLPDETKTLMILLMVISLGVSYFLIFKKGKNYSNKATWVKIINAINIIAGIVIIMLQ